MELMPMTDKQAKRAELLTRIDEIDLWECAIDNNELKEAMEEKKKALRAELQSL